MRDWAVAAGVVVAIGVGAGVAAEVRGEATPAPPRDVVERHISGQVPAPDMPDLARRQYLQERRASDPEFDTVAAYRRARALRAELPLHSERLGAVDLPVAWPHAAMRAAVAGRRVLGQWTPLGPGNIGGRTRTIVIHPQQPETMWVGGVSGGVWKTTNGGQAWFPVADDLANIAVNALVMDPTDPQTLYAGTGEGYFREEVRGTGLPLRGAGIFKTTDGGLSWVRLQATGGVDFHWVNDLVISPHANERLYAATRTGVWRSVDGGGSWTQLVDPQVQGGCLDLAIRPDGEGDTVFAACGTFEQATVYRATNAAGDEPWQAVLSEPGMGRTYLAIAPSAPSTIYAIAASNDGGPGGNFEQGLLAVYRSQAGGDSGSWEARVRNTDPVKLHTLLLTNALPASYQYCGVASQDAWITMGWYCNVLAVDPVDPDVLWAGGVDLFRSDDGGRSWGLASYWWSRTSDSFVHADQHALAFHPDYDGESNQVLFTGCDGGVFRTDEARAAVGRGNPALCDPESSQVGWTALNNGLAITQFYHGLPAPGGDWVLGGAQDNGTILGIESAGLDGWQEVLGGDGGYVAIDPNNPRVLYAEWQWLSLAKSTDGGYSFEYVAESISDPAPLFITPFVMDSSEPSRLWTGGQRLWRTDTGGQWWTAASTPLAGGGSLSAVAVSPHTPDLVVAGTSDGTLHRSDEARAARSTTQWAATKPRAGWVSSVAFDPVDPEVVYATYAGFGGAHLWRSEDAGLSWTALDDGKNLPDIPVHSVVVHPTDSRQLFLGTDLGVFTSMDGGHRWMVENTGFASAVTEWLTVGEDRDGTPWLYAFTHGRGAWKVPLRGRYRAGTITGAQHTGSRPNPRP